MGNNDTEGKACASKPIDKELEGYGHYTDIHAADRDGDLFYIECPNCKNTELIRRTFLGCKHCMTNFSLYFEDGLITLSVITESGSLSGYNEAIKIVQFGKDNYFWYPIYGRNERKVKELREKYPDAKFKTLMQDLHKGSDAHEHQKYRRFAIIPLD